MVTTEKVYLDYAASTPVGPEVLKAIAPYFRNDFGNPGSLHTFGQKALAAIDESREIIADAVGAKFGEVIFTSSATEANNLALRGAVRALPEKFRNSGKVRIITSAIEHESVRETLEDLEEEGIEVIYLRVNRSGIISLKELSKNLNEWTVLVSIIYANNEVGVTEPIPQIAKLLDNFRKSKTEKTGLSSTYPLLHTDAAQALQFLDCNVERLGIDLMSLSGQKIYSPKGAGVLYKKKESPLHAVITGGLQEKGMRAGTENVPAIVGFGKALELILKNQEKETQKIAKLRNYLWERISKIDPKIRLNGPPLNKNRLPNNLHIYIPGHSSQDLIIKLDLAGIAVSAGSACSVRSFRTSHVLEALGFSKERSGSSIRFSLGRPTTKKDIDRAVSSVKNIIERNKLDI